MQIEEQDPPVAMPKTGPQMDSDESKPKRGGKRPGAGRKPNLAKRLLKGFSRDTIAQAAADIDVGAVIVGLLKAKSERTRLETLAFLRDTLYGRPAQNVSLSGAVVHAHGLWRPLENLSDEEIQLLDSITKKINGSSQDGPQNQIESKPAIEAEVVESGANPPLGMQNRIPAGVAASGSDGLFEAAIAHHQASPSSLTSKRNDKQHIVSIDKRP